MTSYQSTSVPANKNNGFVEKVTVNLIINLKTQSRYADIHTKT